MKLWLFLVEGNSDKIYVDGGMVRNTPFQDLETIYLSRLSTEQKNLNLQKSLIEKKLEENPDNEELQKKLSLLEDKTEKLQHLISKGKPYSIGINVGAGFENKDINKSVSLRLNKSLLEEINKITEVFSISLTDFIRNAIEKEVKEIKNDFFYKLSQVDYCSNEESKEIIEELNKMTEDDLKVTKIKSITLKK